jgi:hypothetical protein
VGRDKVVVIGGGIGITAVVASRLSSAPVECFEAGAEPARFIRETVKRNQANVVVHHSLVGPAVYIYAAEIGPELPISELPKCDVLEMDCEGSEVAILSQMTIRPRAILVETHGNLNAPTHVVRSILESMHYAVTDLGWAEPRLLGLCQKNDVRVLLGLTTESHGCSRSETVSAPG